MVTPTQTSPTHFPPSSALKIPDLTGQFLSFKAFFDLQTSEIDLPSAKQAYFQYKHDYERRFCDTFFSEHHSEPWFLEKYDPRYVQENTVWRVKNAEERHKEFVLDWEKGKFEGMLLREEESGMKFAFDPTYLTLFLGAIPVSVWRKEVQNALHAIPGFLSLSLSEALPSQGFSRFAWARFSTQSACDSACELLQHVQITRDCTISPIPSQPNTTRKAVKTQPPQSLPGLVTDWKHVTELISHLNKLYKIPTNEVVVTEGELGRMEERRKEEQLDVQLLYLRRVYGVCYYCAEAAEDERELAVKCGLIHFRSKVMGTQESPGSLTEKRLQDLYTKCELPLYDSASDSALATGLASLITSLSLPETAPNVRCSTCKKLFFDQKYLRKHVELKHTDLLEAFKTTHYEKLTLERFENDPGKFSYMQSERNTVKRHREDDFDDPIHRQKVRKVVNYSDI